MGSPAARQQLRARHRPHRLIADDQRDLLTRIAQRGQPLQRRRGGGLAHHPVVGVETPLQVTGQHLDRGRVLIDDEEDRLGDRLGHGSTSRRRRTRRPSPDWAMRWQNNCLSLRRQPASAISADLPNECLTVAAGHFGVRYHGYHLCDLRRSRFLVEPRVHRAVHGGPRSAGSWLSLRPWRRTS